MLIVGLLGAGALVVYGNATIGMSRLIYHFADLPGFSVAIAIAGLSAAVYAVRPKTFVAPGVSFLSSTKPWHLALIALIAMILSVDPIYHGFAFSMDEYMTRFQASIFDAGRLVGEVPPAWRDVGRALHHSFARFDTVSGQVYSLYRPGMAALYALLDLVGIGLYASAILSAGSILLVASVARHLWPRSDTAPVIAALILATSQQVLITGLTSYAMSAHLFFNLLWLRLFFLDRPWAHVLAAIVGVATSALHQVHLHVFFAAPFLLSLFRPYRPRLLLLYGMIYALGLSAIVGWDQIALGGAATAAGHGNVVEIGHGFMALVTKNLRPHGSFGVSSIVANIARLFAWQNLALVPLLVIAARRAEWSRPMRLLAASIALSLVPYVLLMPDQGHGWGYRYLHGLIGNFALLGTAGWLAVEKMEAQERSRTVMSLLVAGTLSVVVMLPLRAFQVEKLVAPFARAYQHISKIAADVVVVDTPSIYYGQDLVRNGPFLENRPVLVDLRHLHAAQVQRLCEAHPHSVAVVGADELSRFDVLKPSTPAVPPSDREKMLDQLRTPLCSPPGR
jgi:hypothetical protein